MGDALLCAGVCVPLGYERVPVDGEQEQVAEGVAGIKPGLWLVVLEVTVVNYGWMFDLDLTHPFLQVIWAIGVSMVCLSALMLLPRGVVLSISLLMIGGHHMLDGLQPAGWEGLAWHVLHIQGPISYHSLQIMIIYPLIPWIGVMGAGYCFASVFAMEPAERNRWLYGIGGGAIVLFVILRGVNGYGDPSPWVREGTLWRTVLSFINVTKYPPSLLYLLMTLGPAIAAMPLLERVGKAGNVFRVYGRVPLFYYILHIYLLHSTAIVASYFFRHNEHVGPFAHPGYSLGVVYVVWASAVVVLYLPCRWFMRVKMSHRKWWLSYL